MNNQQPTILWPEKMVKLSQQYCRVPSSATGDLIQFVCTRPQSKDFVHSLSLSASSCKIYNIDHIKGKYVRKLITQ